MIDVRFLRNLDVSGPLGDGTVGHLSAASGLAQIGQRLYVVADDEHSLGVFDLADDGPGRLVRLFEGDLPSRQRDRKAAKPDLEALTVLPAFAGFPFGALLAVGSGSRANRQRAVLIGLDAHGALDEGARHLDMRPLYELLRTHFPDLNVEGVFIVGGDLCLLQRGNQQSLVNACVRFDWHEFERWIRGEGAVPTARSITAFDLGGIDGVPLSFTDGAAVTDGGWVFCAAAEDTSDSYTDGRCAGSAVGIVSAAGDVVLLEPLSLACKAEGIAVAVDGERLELLLVTDADDRSTSAQMLSVTLPPVWVIGSPSSATDADNGAKRGARPCRGPGRFVE